MTQSTDTKRRDEFALDYVKNQPFTIAGFNAEEVFLILDGYVAAVKAGWDARDAEVAKLKQRLIAMDSLYAERDAEIAVLRGALDEIRSKGARAASEIAAVALAKTGD